MEALIGTLIATSCVAGIAYNCFDIVWEKVNRENHLQSIESLETEDEPDTENNR